MKYQYWKCTICKEEFKTSTMMADFDVEEHLKKHKKEFKRFEKAESNCSREICLVEDKYPERVLGYWIKNITDEKPKKPKKLWKCPKCDEEMTYHTKFHHQSNATTSDGKPYLCKP